MDRRSALLLWFLSFLLGATNALGFSEGDDVVGRWIGTRVIECGEDLTLPADLPRAASIVEDLTVWDFDSDGSFKVSRRGNSGSIPHRYRLEDHHGIHTIEIESFNGLVQKGVYELTANEFRYCVGAVGAPGPYRVDFDHHQSEPTSCVQLQRPGTFAWRVEPPVSKPEPRRAMLDPNPKPPALTHRTEPVTPKPRLRGSFPADPPEPSLPTSSPSISSQTNDGSWD